MTKNKVETNSTFERRKKVQINNIAKILSRGTNRHELTTLIE